RPLIGCALAMLRGAGKTNNALTFTGEPGINVPFALNACLHFLQSRRIGLKCDEGVAAKGRIDLQDLGCVLLCGEADLGRKMPIHYAAVYRFKMPVRGPAPAPQCVRCIVAPAPLTRQASPESADRSLPFDFAPGHARPDGECPGPPNGGE